jgi:DegV family protein with EDD domain
MIKIVTDSAAGLATDVIQQHGIEVVPLYVHFGEQTYRDGLDLSNERFFAMLKAVANLPTTSQPSAGDFVAVYRRLAADGSTLLSIHLSSVLSGTFASACAARDMMIDADIHVVDTLTISACQGLMVMEAVRAATAGQSIQAILDRLEVMKNGVKLYFAVDTLEYIHKGGRIGGAEALLGTLLQMKPILTLQNGRVESFERVRTRAKAVARLREIVLEGAAGHSQVRLGILHAAAPDEAQKLHDDLVGLVNPVEVMFFEVGPVIATHTGPGTVGVALFVE